MLHEFHKFYSDVAQPNTLGADLYMAEEVEHLLSINDSGNSELFPVYYINCRGVLVTRSSTPFLVLSRLGAMGKTVFWPKNYPPLNRSGPNLHHL